MQCLGTLAVAEIVHTSMVIGEEWTTVREVRRVHVQAGEQELLLEEIPDTADVSSLVIRTRRIPVELLSWHRSIATPDAMEPGAPDDLRITFQGDVQVGMHGLAQQARHEASGGVVCRIRFPVAGTHLFDVHYRMQGIHWAADYQVFLRGQLDDADEQMAVGLTAMLRLKNTSDRDFDGAIVWLTGGDPRVRHRPVRLPGFLIMIEGPLADLWQTQEPLPRIRQLYPVPRPINVPRQSRADIVFADAPRIPATRLYVMDSERIPLSRLGTFHPLDPFLTFPNTAALGLGQSLPPGPVAVYQGVARRTLQRIGFLPHTLPDQEIRVALGPTAEVMGMRRSFGRTARQGNQQEELFELGVWNHRSSPVTVEIRERPPATLGWTLLRITQDFEERRGVIVMRPRLAGDERRRIDLRLRLQVPEPF